MSCKGWGCFVSSPDADRMRRLESRDYSCKPELQARDFSREKLTHDTTGDASPKHIHYKKKENAVAAFRKLLEDCRDEGWLVDEGCPFDRCMEELYFQHCLPNGNVYTICLDKDREPWENA